MLYNYSGKPHYLWFLVSEVLTVHGLQNEQNPSITKNNYYKINNWLSMVVLISMVTVTNET